MSLKYAYGYIRVSTHDQEEISPDSQEHLLRDYAAKNNIVILKIFTDLGISGRKADKRPGFQEMIDLAKGPDHPYLRATGRRSVRLSDRTYHRVDG